MTTIPPRPTSIRIFLADGVPEGLLIVEKSNWTGRAVVASRAHIDRALKREELQHPGVYVLTGESDEGSPQIYVGEADVLRDRLKQHVVNKDFWSRFVAFSSTNEGLNKALARYLEARLIGLAKEANQWEVENSTQPTLPPLSEADRADAEWFLAEMLVIFPLLGVDAFEPASAETQKNKESADGGSVELFLRAKGADARGYEAADGFLVLKGSMGRHQESKAFNPYMRNIRKQLLERGVLEPRDDGLLFTQDYRFSSPSTAAAVVLGRNANGRTAWKDENGNTLKAIQEARVET